MNSGLGGGGCQHWVPTGSQQHENLTGALVLRGSAFFHRHLLKLHNARMVWSTELEWEAENGDRRRGDAQGAVWTAQLELKVRSEGRKTRNTSVPALEEEVLAFVFLHVSHECPCGSQRHSGQ